MYQVTIIELLNLRALLSQHNVHSDGLAKRVLMYCMWIYSNRGKFCVIIFRVHM
jgi:hypothetical protein